jgi:hypothetical protein
MIRSNASAILLWCDENIASGHAYRAKSKNRALLLLRRSNNASLNSKRRRSASTSAAWEVLVENVIKNLFFKIFCKKFWGKRLLKQRGAFVDITRNRISEPN